MVLYLQATAAAQTATLSVGVTVLGQPVSAFTAVALPYGASGDIVEFGPFHSQLDTPGTTTVSVVLTSTTVKAALVQIPGIS